MPGPLPSPNSRRRRTPMPDAYRTLPPVYDGAVPKYPLGRLSKSEMARWRELWRLPQAAAWADLNMADQVARYFGLSVLIDTALAAGEAPKAALLGELRALEMSLALTPMALARLRWKIGDPADVVDLRPAHVPVRQRVRAVDPAMPTTSGD